MTLLTSVDMLLMRATTGARAMFARALFSLGTCGIFVALFASLHMLLMRATPGTGAMVTRALFSLGATGIFMTLLTSFNVLVMVTALVSHFTIPFSEKRRSFLSGRLMANPVQQPKLPSKERITNVL
ncbi:hypothetical protein [Acetobacter cerevisiae]|uniref:hypothetical protein n=1 Tax=Acetobacter cerevisiae TaxID=178900 RepID=UPI000A4D28CF|nr:hypothetical protein [Acetobacter cerevisiae]